MIYLQVDYINIIVCVDLAQDETFGAKARGF